MIFEFTEEQMIEYDNNVILRAVNIHNFLSNFEREKQNIKQKEIKIKQDVSESRRYDLLYSLLEVEKEFEDVLKWEE